MARRKRLRPQPDSHFQLNTHPPAPVRLRDVPVNRTVVFSEYKIEDSKGNPSRVRGDTLVAAAQVVAGPHKKFIPGRDDTENRPGVQRWQNDAWELRDETPELRFIGDRRGRASSRVRLFIGRKENPTDDPTPVTDNPTVVELNTQLFGNAPQVAQLIKRAAQHIEFTGESYLLVSQDPNTNRLSWQAYSSSEVGGSSSTKITVSDGMKTRDVDEEWEIMTRAWTPHPRLLAYPDAPVRACLPIARELRALTQMVGAQTDSRLAGAGILLLPEGVQSAFSVEPPDDWPEDKEYTIGDELTDYMVTPITDRASAASVVPYVLTVPPDMVDKIKHITFASPLDPKLPELRDEAIRRLGLGMDSDPSVLLGMGGANHWTGWLVTEDEVKLGVDPLMATICHAKTVGVLHPILETLGVPDPTEYVVWFDTTPLQLRPDRSKDAQAIFDKGELSGEAMRRENGFGDEDAPDAEEAKRNLLVDLVKGAPSLAPILLPLLGIEVSQQALSQASEIVSATTGDDPGADTEQPQADPPANEDNRSLPARADSPDTEEPAP